MKYSLTAQQPTRLDCRPISIQHNSLTSLPAICVGHYEQLTPPLIGLLIPSYFPEKMTEIEKHLYQIESAWCKGLSVC